MMMGRPPLAVSHGALLSLYTGIQEERKCGFARAILQIQFGIFTFKNAALSP